MNDFNNCTNTVTNRIWILNDLSLLKFEFYYWWTIAAIFWKLLTNEIWTVVWNIIKKTGTILILLNFIFNKETLKK